MRKSRVLAKFRNGEPARICSLGHFLPFFVRYAAHFRYDAIWIDLEHRAMENREVQSLLALCHMYDIDAMVRPASIERNRLYRYLEDGATGFLVPFVSDRATAVKIVEAAKFPPIGNRGLDGVGLDADFGLQGWGRNDYYTEEANQETFIIAQIETPEAVTNAREIASVEGIDALFVGTGDLGFRLATGPSRDTIELDAAVRCVSEAARRHGKAWGGPCGSLEAASRYLEMGAQVLAYGGDFELRSLLQSRGAELDSVLSEKHVSTNE